MLGIQAVPPELEGVGQFVDQGAFCRDDRRGAVVVVARDHMDQQGTHVLIGAQQARPHRRLEDFSRPVDEPHAPSEFHLPDEHGLFEGLVPDLHGLAETGSEIHRPPVGFRGIDRNGIQGPPDDLPAVERRGQVVDQVQEIGVIGRSHRNPRQGVPAQRGGGVRFDDLTVPEGRFVGAEQQRFEGVRGLGAGQCPAGEPVTDLKNSRSRPIIHRIERVPPPRRPARIRAQGDDADGRRGRHAHGQGRVVFGLQWAMIPATGAAEPQGGERRQCGRAD